MPLFDKCHRLNLLAQVDALVRAVHDALREVLASRFWTHLRHGFEAAQDELLARPEQRVAGLEDAGGPRGLQSLRVTDDEGGATCGADAETQTAHRGSAAESAGTEGGAAGGHSRGVDRAAAANFSPAESRALPAEPAEIAVLISPEYIDGHRPSMASLGDCALDEQPAQVLGVTAGCKEARQPAPLLAWAGVRQLIVFGLGSLESGAERPMSINCLSGHVDKF